MKSARGVDLVGGLGLLDAELAVALGGHERVVGDDVHAEARARAAATSWPMRPKPRMPSVFS